MKLTIPSIENLEGNKKLSVFENNKITAKATDFAKALGVGTLIRDDFYSGYVLKDFNSNKLVTSVYNEDLKLYFSPKNRFMGIRLMTAFSDISQYCSDLEINEDGHVFRANCFLYPNNVTNENVRLLTALTRLYGVDPTHPYLNIASSITIDSYPINSELPFFPKTVEQHIYHGKIYTGILSNTFGKIVLSDNNYYDNNEFIWFESKPIVWDIDQDKNIAITHDIITGGIPFDTKDKYKGRFERTALNYYLNNYLKRDLINSVPYSKVGNQYKKTRY